MKILAQKGESSSRKQVCQTLLENWPKLSSFLDSLWETGLFSEPTFQNQIVGLAESDAQLQQVKGQFVGALQEFLSSSLPVDADAEFLSEFESQCNLCLWWWCGQGHKNLNFGRLVLSLGVLPSVVSKVCGLNVLLSTQGLMFSATEEAMDRSPQRASPIPGQFQNFLREHGSSFSTESAADVSLRFLRNLQRQVCLVIEHWEAANALLAVQHGALMKQRKVLDQESFHTSLAELQDHMAQVRDHEALWCLGAFREVQECLQAPYFSAPQDLQSEKLATRSLLFGALQKICLPSSVSRHRYCDTVIDQFFAILRAEQQSEDSCASLMISSMGFKWAKLVSLGDSVEQSSLKDVRQIREMDPRHCDLGFECSHFLKIISWKLVDFSRSVTLIFCSESLNLLCPRIIFGRCLLIHWPCQTVFLSLPLRSGTGVSLNLSKIFLRWNPLSSVSSS